MLLPQPKKELETPNNHYSSMELKNDVTWSSPTVVMMIWKEEARSKDFDISLNRRRKERSIGILLGDGDYILA